MSRSKHRKLRVQPLQSRKLMAGDAFVSVVDGDLHIDEAPGDEGLAQEVQVYRLSNGLVRVNGLGDTDIRREVNFNGNRLTLISSYADFQVADDIFARLGSGDDRFSMLNYNGGIDADLVDIDMGGGGSDRDAVQISGLTTSHELRIDTGFGADQVSVSGATIGDSGWEDLEINTGAGADYVTISSTTVADNVDVEMFANSSEWDVDRLRVDGIVAKDIVADLGNGDDQATIQFTTLQNDIHLDMGYEHAYAGQDDDYVFLGFNQVDDIRIEGRDGNDDVRAAYNTADEVDFDGGSGVDRFFSYYGSTNQNSNDFDDLDLHSASFERYGVV